MRARTALGLRLLDGGWLHLPTAHRAHQLSKDQEQIRSKFAACFQQCGGFACHAVTVSAYICDGQEAILSNALEEVLYTLYIIAVVCEFDVC